MISNDLIVEIYRYTESKLQMIEAFPWLEYIIPKCACGKDSNYVVKFEYDNSCHYCGDRINVSDDVYVCNFNCRDMYYYDVEDGDHTTKPSMENNYKIQALLFCDRDDCFHCGRRISYNVIANGYQLRRTKYQKNVELFVKNHLMIEDSNYHNSKINIYKMVELYKKYFNIVDNPEKKSHKVKRIIRERNREIQSELFKVLNFDGFYYVGCKPKS